MGIFRKIPLIISSWPKITLPWVNDCRCRGFTSSIDPQRPQIEPYSTKKIEAAFGDLAKDFKPEDTFVLFLAGHGRISQVGSHCFPPWEIEYDSDAALEKQGFREDRLRGMMARIPAQSLLLLDTCRSGSALTLTARAVEDKGAISHLARTSQSQCKMIGASGTEGAGFSPGDRLRQSLRRDLYSLRLCGKWLSEELNPLGFVHFLPLTFLELQSSSVSS